jgi:hypothetical protein
MTVPFPQLTLDRLRLLTRLGIMAMMLEMASQPRATRWLGWVFALALMLVPSATCLIAAWPPEKMACHDAMEIRTEASLDEPCCPGDSAASPSSTPVGQLAPWISAPGAVLIAVLPEVQLLIPAGAGTIEPPGTRKPPGPPTYVLVSSFRI